MGVWILTSGCVWEKQTEKKGREDGKGKDRKKYISPPCKHTSHNYKDCHALGAKGEEREGR